jgi:uncharacterized protein YggL (DUF469 family)
MKKRLRKKLRRGEFKQFGFELDFQFIPDFKQEDFERFFDDFIKNGIEANKLTIGGGGDKLTFGGFVTSLAERGSLTNNDRTNLENWLKQQTCISKYTIGVLVDAWK